MNRMIAAITVSLFLSVFPGLVSAGPPGPPPGLPPTATDTACRLLSGAPGLHTDRNIVVESIDASSFPLVSVIVRIAEGSRIRATLLVDTVPPFQGCLVVLPGLGPFFVTVTELTVIPPGP